MDNEKLVILKDGKELEVTLRLWEIYYSNAGWVIKESTGAPFVPPAVPSTHVEEELQPGELDVIAALGAERALDQVEGHKYEGHDFK